MKILRMLRDMKIVRDLIAADVWMLAVLPALMVVDHAVDGEVVWTVLWAVVLLSGVYLIVDKVRALRKLAAAEGRSAAQEAGRG